MVEREIFSRTSGGWPKQAGREDVEVSSVHEFRGGQKIYGCLCLWNTECRLMVGRSSRTNARLAAPS